MNRHAAGRPQTGATCSSRGTRPPHPFSVGFFFSPLLQCYLNHNTRIRSILNPKKRSKISTTELYLFTSSSSASGCSLTKTIYLPRRKEGAGRIYTMEVPTGFIATLWSFLSFIPFFFLLLLLGLLKGTNSYIYARMYNIHVTHSFVIS